MCPINFIYSNLLLFNIELIKSPFILEVRSRVKVMKFNEIKLGIA
jgi:hypothetical protein